MGNSLSEQSLESFSEELQKLAGEAGVLSSLGAKLIKRLRPPKTLLGAATRVSKAPSGWRLGSFEETGKRLSSRMGGLTEGWRESSPLPEMGRKAEELGFGSAQEAAAHLKAQIPTLKAKIPAKPPKRPLWSRLVSTTPEEKAYAEAQGAHTKAQGAYKSLLGGGEHLLGTEPGAGRIRALAERLSRGGWTGTGRSTKYLPVGMKSWAVLPAALEIPSIVNAPRPTRTGEGGALEQGLGLLGGTAGFVAGTGLGIAPGVGMFFGGQYAGGRLGRVLDRVRAGASFGQATSAPSPQQATEQLQDIQKYYG